MTTFDRGTCDTVIAAIERTQPDADLMLRMLGLVEQQGHNTREDTKSAPTPTTRKPLWLEPIVGKLSTGQIEMRA